MTDFNIRRLRVQCMLRTKFFGSLLHNCNIKESRDIPTAGVDRKLNILMNPDFMGSLSEDEQLFVLGHELLHAALLHTNRIFEFADHRLLAVGNIAADYLVNFILVEMGMKMPKIVTLYNEKYNPKDYVLESLVKELMKQAQKNKNSNGSGDGKGEEKGDIGAGNDIMEGEGEPLTPQEMKAVERKLKSSLAAAVMQAKKAGNLPGSLERFCDEILKPKINWRHELQDWFNVKVKGAESWERPNRRSVWRGVYRPINKTLGCGHIGLAIDLSGSIGENEVKIWWSELQYIFQTCRPSKLTICYFDTRAHIEVYEDELPQQLKIPNMGGGTDFSVPIEYFNKEVDEDITGLVFMTDMWGDWPDAPEYPMIILSTTANKEAPYGKTVYCDLEQ